MCGIAGHIGIKDFDSNEVNCFLEILKNRGPDGSNWSEIKINESNKINLFFTRLAIIDLESRSMQPMTDGHLTIMLNGEIYNYKSLKMTIEEKFGLQEWKTEGDTEVALRYLKLYGHEGLKDLDGMFAIALWDSQKQELILARDYFGEKPLYYYFDDERVAFASDTKTLFKMISTEPDLNFDKLVNFVVNGYRYIYKGEDEFFLGLKRLMSGQVAIFKFGNLQDPKIYSYKSLPIEFQLGKESRSQAKERIKKSVIRSIGRRLEADVPISLSLSGGVDSCLIAAIAKKDFGVSLHGFTLESQDSRYGEATIAEDVAKFLGIKHTIVKIEKSNFLQRMREIIEYHHSPISTISYYIQNFLTKQIHDAGFKVSLMGTGADELFSGYYDHHLLYLSEMFKRDQSHYKDALDNWTTHVLPLVRNPIFQNSGLYIENARFRDHLYEGAKKTNYLIRRGTILSFHEKEYSTNPMRNRMLNELFNEVVPVILKEDDSNSMMYSVENRSPFLSYEILAESMKTDVRHFIHKGRTKSLLREAFDGYLPNHVLNSYRKVGFNASFTEICDIDADEFQDFLNDDSPYWEIFSRDKVKEVFKNVDKEDFLNKTAFSLVSSKLFFENNYEGFSKNSH